MNVAITRARMKLVIMGNAETLSHTAFYKKLYAYVMGEEDAGEEDAGEEDADRV